MKRFFTILCTVLLVAYVHAITVKDVPNVHLQDSTQFVSNPNGVLSPGAVNQLNQIIRQVWNNSSCELVAVVVDNIEPDDIDLFATALYDDWKIGKKDKDNGVLLVVAKDMRRAAIRTGYGVEGVLPDIICGHILRQDMFPLFKEDDFDSGTIAGVNRVAQILTNPEYAAELNSKYANNALSDENTSDEFWTWFGSYIGLAMLVTIVALIFLWFTYFKYKKQPAYCYNVLQRYSMPMAIIAALGLGIPLIALVRLKNLQRRLRNSERICPQCGAKMHKLDEVHDNDYLNTGQDMEEQLNSVDYDVWLCPNCGEKDVIPFDNPESNFVKCPNCGAKTAQLMSNSILRDSTTKSEGIGERTYYCHHCRTNHKKRYSIPRKVDDSAASAAIVGSILGGMLGGGRSGGFGGGGFGGGSFGGGRTGGGGASGGW